MKVYDTTYLKVTSLSHLEFGLYIGGSDMINVTKLYDNWGNGLKDVTGRDGGNRG